MMPVFGFSRVDVLGTMMVSWRCDPYLCVPYENTGYRLSYAAMSQLNMIHSDGSDLQGISCRSQLLEKKALSISFY